MNNHPSIERPMDNEFDSLKAQHFTKELAGVRLIAQDSLKLTQLHYENSYNQNHIPISFKPGNKVLVNIHSLQLPESKGKGAKFTRCFNGPFEVIEHIGLVAYHIRLPHSYDIHPVLSITHLKPYKSEDGDKRIGLERLREDIKEYEVEEIIAQKRVKYHKGTRLLYQCQWKDYGITEDWIPEKYL